MANVMKRMKVTAQSRKAYPKILSDDYIRHACRAYPRLVEELIRCGDSKAMDLLRELKEVE